MEDNLQLIKLLYKSNYAEDYKKNKPSSVL